MKKIKSINTGPFASSKFLLIAYCVLLLFSACKKFVEVELPKSKVASEMVFSNDNTATSAMTGVYVTMGLDGFACGSNESVLALCGLSADELTNYPRNFNYTQFEDNILLPENLSVQKLWSSMYKAIYSANAVIEGLEGSTGVNAAVKKQLEGEAYFIRAFSHFYLVNLFGDVPLVTTTDYIENSRVSRIATATVYQQIIDDLLTAREKLGNNYITAERLRPNKATASALLARVYLYQGDWVNAEAESSSLITNPAYSLTVDLNLVFEPNSPEIIWQLSPAISGANGYPKEAFFFEPTRAIQNNVLTTTLLSAFEAGDKRQISWLRSYNTGTTTIHCPFKYKQATSSTTPLSEYSVVFRLAEQYLIRAEARVQLNDFQGALADINSIRTRAGLPKSAAADKEGLMTAVEQEKRIEFFTEGGHRWLDLKRWNKATSVLSPVKPEWNEYDVLYPIPQLEMNRNLYLKPQNNGY